MDINISIKKLKEYIESLDEKFPGIVSKLQSYDYNLYDAENRRYLQRSDKNASYYKHIPIIMKYSKLEEYERVVYFAFAVIDYYGADMVEIPARMSRLSRLKYQLDEVYSHFQSVLEKTNGYPFAVINGPTYNIFTLVAAVDVLHSKFEQISSNRSELEQKSDITRCYEESKSIKYTLERIREKANSLFETIYGVKTEDFDELNSVADSTIKAEAKWLKNTWEWLDRAITFVIEEDIPDLQYYAELTGKGYKEFQKLTELYKILNNAIFGITPEEE